MRTSSLLTASLPALLLSGVWAYQTQPAPNLEKLQAQLAKDEKILQDWANLSRYRNENAQLPIPEAGQNRVVFMGDSITDAWGRSRGTFFPGKPYINRGISGQTTPQMLIRFRPDVSALKPKVVVILAGTNDIAGNTGPTTVEEIEGNLASMAQLATANNIKVVLASLLPVCDYIKPQTSRRPPEKIVTLNAWIKLYCTRNHLVYLDYYSAMVDERNMLQKELTYDGLHPNAAGYRVMEPLAERAIETALASH
jgi:lysophospholipase L1-like esterase